jgi:phage anti-repressor protein
MNQLIEINTSEAGIKTVNARDLHAFLEVGKDFSSWIKSRIEQYGFSEGADYLLTHVGEQLASGTKYKIEYHCTLDMAKELSMVERNAKGKQARQYFIECEKVAKSDGKRIAKGSASMDAFRIARAIDMNTKAADRIFSMLPNLGANAKQCILANLINPVMGAEVIALPKVEQHLRLASEFAAELGVTANMIGRLANTHGLKTPEFGEVRLNKAIGHDRQVESFYYNERGINAIADILHNRCEAA